MLTAKGRDLAIWVAVFTLLVLVSIYLRFYIIVKVRRRSLRADDFLIIAAVIVLISNEGIVIWGKSLLVRRVTFWVDESNGPSRNCQRPRCTHSWCRMGHNRSTYQGQPLGLISIWSSQPMLNYVLNRPQSGLRGLGLLQLRYANWQSSSYTWSCSGPIRRSEK